MIKIIFIVAISLGAINATYKEPAKPYSYAYGIKDEYQGLNYGQNEDSDGNSVKGSYSVDLPDGRKQVVNYVSDHVNGFVAEVSYEGHAQYPPPSKGDPFVVRSKGYAPPAPAPYH